MKPTTAQAATRQALEAQGFKVLATDCKSIRMGRGNDFRVIQQDGTQKRAYGEKR